MNLAPLVVVSGTGTEIGKTHLSAALIRAWVRRLEAMGRADAKVAGVKPIETGVAEGTLFGADGETLASASTFHVKQFPPPFLFARPVSPHLAARIEGRVIDFAVILEWVARIRTEADGVLVELPGGLFSPLTENPTRTNADLARDLAPDAVVLVAQDRLGVLHDLGATVRAAQTDGLSISGILLSAPANADSSTGDNTAEVPLVTSVPVLAALPRARASELERNPVFTRALGMLFPSLAEQRIE
ncbi:MAG: dethiobiotin synthase [Polyangiaceae bacterium]|nr:dethiobiotin synthase [Polyangiaceae bacterium]